MALLTTENWKEILGEANLAPSLHNIQPAKVMLSEDRIFIFHDTTRRLPVADASDQDVKISIGCFIEGLRIVLTSKGMKLSRVNEAPSKTAAANLKWVASYQIETSVGVDPLYQWITKRKSHRGTFAKADLSSLQSVFKNDPFVTLVSDPTNFQKIVNWHRDASVHFFRLPEYMKELYSWMRFSRAHPKYSKDGLNAENMALAPIEAWFASGLIHPSVFPIVDKLGIGPALAGEETQTKSASAILLYKAPKNMDLLDVGANFYRTWLKLTSVGWAACPMSATLDFPETRSQLESTIPITKDERYFNILRIGPSPQRDPVRARYEVNEILIQ